LAPQFVHEERSGYDSDVAPDDGKCEPNRDRIGLADRAEAQDDDGRGHQKLIRSRIEQSSESGLLLQDPGSHPIQDISYARNAKNNQSFKHLVLAHHVKKKRDQKDPEHAEKIGDGPKTLFCLFAHLINLRISELRTILKACMAPI
jgi:hypothetical protein